MRRIPNQNRFLGVDIVFALLILLFFGLAVFGTFLNARRMEDQKALDREKQVISQASESQ